MSKMRLLVFVLTIGCSAEIQAQGRPYEEGSVWAMQFIRTEAGAFDDYIENLGDTYKAWFDEAKRQGLVLSYKVISTSAANADDWDILLMVEYKNMAALDGLDEKLQAIIEKASGGREGERKIFQERTAMRRVIGDKLGRELVLK